MKKFLLFLLLFGGGLALLIYLQPETKEPDPLQPEDSNQEDVGDGIQITIGDDEGGQEVEFIPAGAWEVTGDGERDPETGQRPRLYHFKTTDLSRADQEEGSLSAQDVTLRLFDSITDTVRAILTANRAFLTLEAKEGGGFDIASSRPVRLESVDLTIVRGAPVVPIHFRVPVLTWTRFDETFRSDDRVVLDSPGLTAEGTGMEVVSRTGRESITLMRDGVMNFELENGLEAKLEALGLGPLVLSRQLADAQDRVRLTVDDGSRLTLQDGSVLRAKSLTVEGIRELKQNAQGEEVGQFTLTGVVATGEVSVQGEQGTLYGSEGVLEFDRNGEPTLLTVTGAPRAELTVESSPGEFATVLIEGAGPLIVNASASRRFELAGPAVATWQEEGVVVRASDWIRGSLDKSEEQSFLIAQGAVRVSHPEATLEGERLRVAYDKESETVQQVQLVVDGPSRFQGQDESGRTIHIDAVGEITARTTRIEGEDQDRLVLQRAEGVTARFESTVEGEEPFTATAGVLRDFDLSARTFFAESGVTYEAQGARAEGERVVVRGDQDFELYGSPVGPAIFRITEQREELSSIESIIAEAAYIRATPDRLIARDAVDLSIEAENRSFEARMADLTIEWLGPEDPDGAPRPYRVVANRIERAGVIGENEELSISCERLLVNGTLGAETDEERIRPFELDATGTVRVELAGRSREISEEITGSSTLVGFGERFQWSATGEPVMDSEEGFDWTGGQGRLSTDVGKRVRSVGNLAGEQLPYELSADWITFNREQVVAQEPRLRIDSTNLATSQGERREDQTFEATARRLIGTRTQIRMEDDVELTGASTGQYSWSLDSDIVEINFDLEAGSKPKNPDSPVPSALESVVAIGNLSVHFNEDLSGTGDRMVATDDKLRLEGRPAHLQTAAFAWESGWIEFSIRDEVVTTGSGTLSPAVNSPDQGWQIRYESLQPFQEGEVTILALRNVLVTRGESTLRSNWALFWIDNEEWKKADNPLMKESGDLRTERVTQRPVGKQQPKNPTDRFKLFQSFGTSSISHVLNEIYVEGDVEYLIGTERVVRAESLYVDLVEGRSWIQNADLVIKTPETRGESLRVKAEWIRHSEDGSLRAEDATLTSCSHDVPHYVIEVGTLRMDPVLDEESLNTYRISLTDNSLRLQNGYRVPLPGGGIELDEQGSIDPSTATIAGLQLPNVTLGNSAKFGTTVQTQFSRSFGRLGRMISKSSENLFNLERNSVRGSWNYNAAWYGSRGLLLGLGFDVTDRDRFLFRAQADGIPDGERDRGLVRVPEANRDTFRAWYRARGRYYLDEDEYIDLRFTHQTDAGVQAEFFEREYVAYEQRETYLQWRKARDQFFYSVTVEASPPSYQTEVQDLPSATFQRGRTPLFWIGNVPLLYTAKADAEHLRRHSGSQEVPFNDGFNGPTVSRFDTSHRIETPVPIGKSGLKLTPFMEGRATAWDENQTGDGNPFRAALMGGGQMSMAFWKRSEGGRVHTITPKAGARVTMGVDESGGQPIFFDEVENPIEGHFVDLGVRSIWRTPDPNRYIDLDVTATHANDVDANLNGWAVATYAMLRQYLLGMPIAIVHDGRYDLDDSLTDYSRTFFGIKPWERLELGTGYNSGRTQIDERLYETASISARFQATPKWDLEFFQTFNLKGTEDLETRFLIRRFGHDLLFELEIRDRAGEGTGFSIGVRPRIGWTRSRLGLFDN